MPRKRILDDWATYAPWYKYQCRNCSAYVRHGDAACHRCEKEFTPADCEAMRAHYESLNEGGGHALIFPILLVVGLILFFAVVNG